MGEDIVDLTGDEWTVTDNDQMILRLLAERGVPGLPAVRAGQILRRGLRETTLRDERSKVQQLLAENARLSEQLRQAALEAKASNNKTVLAVGLLGVLAVVLTGVLGPLITVLMR